MQNSNKSPLSEKQKPANSAPLASPLAVSPKAASDYKNTASAAAEADKFFKGEKMCPIHRRPTLICLGCLDDSRKNFAKELFEKLDKLIDKHGYLIAIEKLKKKYSSENSFSSKPANSLTATKPFSDGGGEK